MLPGRLVRPWRPSGRALTKVLDEGRFHLACQATFDRAGTGFYGP